LLAHKERVYINSKQKVIIKKEQKTIEKIDKIGQEQDISPDLQQHLTIKSKNIKELENI